MVAVGRPHGFFFEAKQEKKSSGLYFLSKAPANRPQNYAKILAFVF